MSLQAITSEQRIHNKVNLARLVKRLRSFYKDSDTGDLSETESRTTSQVCKHAQVVAEDLRRFYLRM